MPPKKAFLITVLGILLASCGGEPESNNQRGEFVIPVVEAVQARYGSLPLVQRFSGNVKSENQVPLYPEISARVEQVFVENGDFVNKGDVLVKLESNQLEKQLQQAQAGMRINAARLKQSEAQFNETKSRYDRAKLLAERDLSSASELEQIEAELLSADADVELAKAQLDQSEAIVAERRQDLSETEIKAPISGTIGQRNANPGMQANMGTPLFIIGDLTKLRVEIILTENMMNQIQVGQTAQISITDNQGNPQILTGKLSRVSPFLNEVSRSTEGEIDLENKNGLLRPGMFVPVDINFGESERATLIPTSAIFINPTTGKEGVYIASSIGTEIVPVSNEDADNALTSATPVTFQPLNIVARGKMEVGVSNLDPESWIVTLGQNLLTEGRGEARVKTIAWDRVIALQNMKREDLLKQIIELGSDSPAGLNL